MQNIKITINGAEVDIDKKRLPLSFSRLVDKLEEVVGSEGTRARALSDTLYLPATQRNSEIFSLFDIYDYDSKSAQGLLEVQLFVNGTLTSSAYGQRLAVSKLGVVRDTFAVKILGDSTDVYTRLENLSLRDLPMGDADTDHTDLEASWTPLSDTSNPLVWAPIYYGGQGNGITVVASGFAYTTGLRPSVRFWKILEAMFETQLGYKIVSNIYSTEMFRNAVYPFGVGDAWKRTDDIEPYKCYVGTSGQLALSPPVATVKFDDESAPYSDPQNMNILASIFKPTVGGWYVFQFHIIGSGIERVVLRGRRSSPLVVNINLGEYEPNVLNITEPILFEPHTTAGMSEMIFTVEQSNPSATMTIEAGSFYKAELTDRFSYTAPLSIASCLHDRPQKDFLRGLQHLFGLVIAIDNVNKEVYIDPRFVNTTQPATIPEALVNQRDGYYKVEDEAQALRLDASTSLTHKRAFGDSLTIGFAEDNNDALYTYLKQKSADAYEVPLYGARVDFIQADKKGTTILNPFFAPMLTVRFYSGVGAIREARWGCIVDSFDDDLLTSGLIGETDAKYECAIPKAAMYYGVLDFDFAPYEWVYIGTPASGAGGGANRFDIPTVLGVFPNDDNYLDLLGGVPFNLSYADITYDGLLAGVTSLGLLNRYYQKYLAIMYQDKWLTASSVVDLLEYRTDYFAGPKLVTIGGQRIRAWQYKTNSFNPIEGPIADIELVLDYDNIDGSTYEITQNTDNPLLTTGYLLEVSNTGK